MAGHLYTKEKEFYDQINKFLNASPLNFLDELSFIHKSEREGNHWSISGILVLLEYDPIKKEHVIILNKRSDSIQQPGDLCCPGGGTGQRMDRVVGYLLSKNLIPRLFPGPFRCLGRSFGAERRILGLVLAGALRESWEEIRLPPCRVECLGGLPAYRLESFPKSIFPMVGRVNGNWQPRPNWEVEKIIRVPVRLFQDPANYGLQRLRIPASLSAEFEGDLLEHPCLIVREKDHEEILWGVTFNILFGLLQPVMDLPMDIMNHPRVVERDIPTHYFTGKK